jgi:hypothetical protein
MHRRAFVGAAPAGQRWCFDSRCGNHATKGWTMIEPRDAFRLLHRAIVLATLACLALLAGVALAQDADDSPPARVGRIAIVLGDLYIAPQDRSEEWAAIGANHPIATGDNLWVSGEGRAEVDYGGGRFRLGPDSNVHVSRLDDAEVALFVAQGRLVVRVRVLDPGEAARIDTPNAQIQLDRPGLYRIDVSPEPRQTWVVVREGHAGVVLPGGVQEVLPGQTANVVGTDSAVAEVVNGAGIDGLDTWSAERDRVYDRAGNTAAYVSRQMVGYADLESQGSWQSYPEYGAVWFPTTVVNDWAPYRYGRWVWLSAYGWTWVDDAPWGYAPFHYGRWAYIGGRWGWCPGAFVARPVWAPALVAWYGGSGWSYSTSYGGPVFGWVPLGWRDPYVPWWGRCSNRCYARYNRPYAVDVTVRSRQPVAVYANARVPGAVTAMPASALRETRPVQSSRIALPAQGLANAPVLAAAPTVKPALLSTRVVQPGRGAPQPAGEIAARVRPQALSPFATPGMVSREPQVTAPAVTRERNVVPPSTQVRGGVPAAVPQPPTVLQERGTYSGASRERMAAPPAVNAVPPAAVARPVSPAVNAVPPSTTTRQANPPGSAERPAVRAVPPAGVPSSPNARIAPQAPVSAVPPAAVAPRVVTPPPQAPRAGPQAPVSAVPPAAVAPHAAAPPPPPSPQGREAPSQRPGQPPNGPRQQQN